MAYKLTPRRLQKAIAILDRSLDTLVRTEGKNNHYRLEMDLRELWNVGYQELKRIMIDMLKHDRYKYVAARYMETSNCTGVVCEFQRPLAELYGVKIFSNITMEKDRETFWNKFSHDKNVMASTFPYDQLKTKSPEIIEVLFRVYDSKARKYLQGKEFHEALIDKKNPDGWGTGFGPGHIRNIEDVAYWRTPYQVVERSSTAWDENRDWLFEGDIIKCQSKLYVVIFWNYAFQLLDKNGKLTGIPSTTKKIIGTIHDEEYQKLFEKSFDQLK